MANYIWTNNPTHIFVILCVEPAIELINCPQYIS